MLSPMLSPDFVLNLLLGLLLVALAVCARYVLRLYRERQLPEVAAWFVQAAEQMFRNSAGEVKLEEVMLMLQRRFPWVEEETLRWVVEATVYVVKGEQGEVARSDEEEEQTT